MGIPQSYSCENKTDVADISGTLPKGGDTSQFCSQVRLFYSIILIKMNMTLITNETLGKEGWKLILAETSNKPPTLISSYMKKILLPENKMLNISSHWSLGLKVFSLELTHAGKLLAEHSTTGFICCLGMIYQRPWCSQVNIEALWHLMIVSAALLWTCTKPLSTACATNCRERESRDTASGLTHTQQIKMLQNSSGPLVLSAPLLPRCSLLGLAIPLGSVSPARQRDAQPQSGDAYAALIQVWDM